MYDDEVYGHLLLIQFAKEQKKYSDWVEYICVRQVSPQINFLMGKICKIMTVFVGVLEKIIDSEMKHWTW